MENKFIEHDNHNGLMLLKAAVMNSITECFKEKAVIHLDCIPINLIKRCLNENNLEYKEYTILDYHIIDVFLGQQKIINISTDASEGTTIIRNVQGVLV